jgi:hypothetical protein
MEDREQFCFPVCDPCFVRVPSVAGYSYDTLKLAYVYTLISRYLGNPAPFEDYLRQCDEAASETRRKIEQRDEFL